MCLSRTLALDDDSGTLSPSPRPDSHTGQQDQQRAPGSCGNVQQQQIWKRVCFISLEMRALAQQPRACCPAPYFLSHLRITTVGEEIARQVITLMRTLVSMSKRMHTWTCSYNHLSVAAVADTRLCVLWALLQGPLMSWTAQAEADLIRSGAWLIPVGDVERGATTQLSARHDGIERPPAFITESFPSVVVKDLNSSRTPGQHR